MKKDLMSKLAKSLKIALAALLAAALAGGLGLQYATTAGIITILSIQGTKLEGPGLSLRPGAGLGLF